MPAIIVEIGRWGDGEEVVNYRSARVARTMPAHVEEGQNNFQKSSQTVYTGLETVC